MPYIDENGNTKYTLKDKIDYHTKCANDGVKPTGEVLTTTQRIRHANCATKCVNKLNRFMKTGTRLKEIKNKLSSNNKSKSKSAF